MSSLSSSFIRNTHLMLIGSLTIVTAFAILKNMKFTEETLSLDWDDDDIIEDEEENVESPSQG